MIELDALSKSYQVGGKQVTALNDVSLTVERGEVFGIIGRSGAGKSTLIRCINLLERPTTGRVVFDGQSLLDLDAASLRRVRQQMGMVFQHFNLLQSRTVYQNIALPLRLLGKSSAEIDRTLQPLLELTQLTTHQHHYPAQLSGGQKQRVAIARALTTRPSVLLCDEMTSSLDPETTASILNLIRSINQEMQVTIFLITHEMEVIKEIADTVAVIDKGHLVETSGVVELFTQPKSDIARQLLESNLHMEIPPVLRQRLAQGKAQRILRLGFVGRSAEQAVISEAVRRFNVDVNIFQADLENIKGQTVGLLLIGLAGELADQDQAIAYFKEQQLTVDELL